MPYSLAPPSGNVNRVERLMINLDTAMPMICGWDECDRRARTPYQVRVHEHPAHVSCSAVAEAGGALGRHAHYVFCQERHLLYFVHSSGWRANDLAAHYGGRIHGFLPPGDRFR